MNRDPDLDVFANIPDPFDETGAAAGPVARRPDFFAPARARVRTARAIAFAAALAYETLWLVVLKTHGGGRPAATIAAGLLIPLVAGVAALSGAIRRGARGLGEPVAAIAGATSGALVLFVMATLLAAPADVHDGGFWRSAIGCVGVSSLFAMGPLAFGLHAFRRGFASASAWRAAALGMACGACATVMMSVVCPDGGGFHVLLGHGTAMVLGGAIGALLGPRIARA